MAFLLLSLFYLSRRPFSAKVIDHILVRSLETAGGLELGVNPSRRVALALKDEISTRV